MAVSSTSFTEGHNHSAKPRKRRTEQALEAPDEQKLKKKSEKIDKMAVFKINNGGILLKIRAINWEIKKWLKRPLHSLKRTQPVKEKP